VQDIFEAAAFLAEAVLDRDFKILDEQFVGIDGLAAHLLDLMHRDALAVEIGIEQAEAVGRVSSPLPAAWCAPAAGSCSATCAVEIQTFWPLTMYLSPLRTARVFSCVVLRPVLGSVTAKQDLSAPSTIGGSMRCTAPWCRTPRRD
jgi:hypothetical protein